jgi:hypothetical protein
MAAELPWPALALLRPGLDVFIINVSSGGALLDSQARLSPGARAELQLLGERRRLVRGTIDRCEVVCLAPLRYRGAMVFEEPLLFEREPPERAAG